jgi:hypothetical protein
MDAQLKRPKSRTPALDYFCTDFTEQARQGKFDPVVGRQKEIQRVMSILSRKQKNNPALIGDPGTGKTAIVVGLAQRIAKGQVPPHLVDKRILALDLAAAPLTPSAIEFGAPANRLMIRFETTPAAAEQQAAAARDLCQRHGAGTSILQDEAEREAWREHEASIWDKEATLAKIAVLPTYFVTPPAMFLPVWYALLFAVYALTLIALGEVRREDWMHLKSLLPHGGRRGTTPTEIAH